MTFVDDRSIFYQIILLRNLHRIMRENTKKRILETGAEIIHLKGYNNTGIQEILNSVGVPKGSFYNYFKNKEDFGLQVIDYYKEHFGLLSENILENGSIPPLERIKKVLELFIALFRSRDYAYGCPIGNLSQEMGDLSPAFRQRLKSAIDSMVDGYSKVLAEAQMSGEISKFLNVRETANFIVSSWHGALMRMKIVKGPEPLENHMRFIFNYVLKP